MSNIHMFLSMGDRWPGVIVKTPLRVLDEEVTQRAFFDELSSVLYDFHDRKNTTILIPEFDNTKEFVPDRRKDDSPIDTYSCRVFVNPTMSGHIVKDPETGEEYPTTYQIDDERKHGWINIRHGKTETRRGQRSDGEDYAIRSRATQQKTRLVHLVYFNVLKGPNWDTPLSLQERDAFLKLTQTLGYES